MICYIIKQKDSMKKWKKYKEMFYNGVALVIIILICQLYTVH